MKRLVLVAFPILLAGAALVVALGLLDSDDESGSKYPPVAEPADAPPLTENPVGKLYDVGSMPEGLAIDPATGLIAIGLREPNLLAIFDPDRGEVVRRVPVDSAPRHLGFDEANHSVLVPAEQTDDLVEVPLPRGTPTTIAVGDHPHDAAAAPNGRVFVGNEFGDTLSVLDGDKVVSTLPSDEQPGGVEAAGRDIVVIAVAQRTLSVFDSDSLEELASVPAGVGPTHVETLGERAFVADTDGGSILEYEISADPRRVADTKLDGAPYGMALDEKRKRLWVTQTAKNAAVEFAIEPKGLRKVATYPTVRQPNTIIVEPASGDAFVASRTDGVLQRITPEGS